MNSQFQDGVGTQQLLGVPVVHNFDKIFPVFLLLDLTWYL